MMDLDELQSVRDRERQTDKLQQLRETFYADAGEFIQALRDQRERAAERADDPFDAPEVSRLSDEIDTAEQTVEAIYEKRVGKIVKAASFAAADLPAESDGMTAEEKDLFETLVADIKENRQHVLDVLAGDVGPEETTGGDSDAIQTPDDTESSEPAAPDHAPPEVVENAGTDEVSAADVMGSDSDTTVDSTDGDGQTPPPPEADQTTPAADDGDPATADMAGAPAGGDSTVESDQPAPPEAVAGQSTAKQETEPAPETEPEVRKDGGTAEKEAGVERETVRITADVGDIFGVDEREYDLSTDDVVTLPAANADPLVERDAAERL